MPMNVNILTYNDKAVTMVRQFELQILGYQHLDIGLSVKWWES